MAIFMSLVLPRSCTEVVCDATDSTRRWRKQMKTAAAKTDFIFLSIGGNISPIADPEYIFSNICDLVKEFQGIGVRRVYISEILPRADFSKRGPPGLSKSKFDRDKKISTVCEVRRERHQIPWHTMSKGLRWGSSALAWADLDQQKLRRSVLDWFSAVLEFGKNCWI